MRYLHIIHICILFHNNFRSMFETNRSYLKSVLRISFYIYSISKDLMLQEAIRYLLPLTAATSK